MMVRILAILYSPWLDNERTPICHRHPAGFRSSCCNFVGFEDNKDAAYACRLCRAEGIIAVAGSTQWVCLLRSVQEGLTGSFKIHRQRALTPIIAGTISGTCIVVAWTVALVVALLKRHRRKQRFVRMLAGAPDVEQKGGSEKSEKSGKAKDKEPVIVPPDPAVVLGVAKPGEYVVGGKKNKGKIRGKGKARERLPLTAICSPASESKTSAPSASSSKNTEPGGPSYLSPTWSKDSNDDGMPVSSDGRTTIRTYGSKTILDDVKEEDFAFLRSRQMAGRRSNEPRRHSNDGPDVEVVQCPTGLEVLKDSRQDA